MQRVLLNPRLYYGWIVVGTVFLVLFMSAGTRFSFGAFYHLLLQDFGWSRAELAGAASLNLILAGLARPVFGVFVDRYGSKPVMIAGLGAAVLAMALLSFASQLWHFYVLFSVLSVGYGAASPSTTVSLISRWFVRRKATAQSIANAGSPMGELLIVPIITAVLIFADWHTAYRILAGLVALLVIPLVVALIREDPQEVGLYADGAPTPVAAAAHAARQPEMTLRQALRLPLFWQLTFGFFVCGFTMTFASTHFVAFADDHRISPMTASLALGMVGGVSIFGSVLLSYLGDRYSAKNALALTYLLRGLGFFILWQTSGVDVLFIAAFVLGLSWGTVALTASCLSDACGRRALGTIFGVMFAVMPVGSGIGAYLAGWLFDAMGSYDLALLLDGVLGIAAAVTIYRLRPGAIDPEVAKPVPARAAG